MNCISFWGNQIYWYISQACETVQKDAGVSDHCVFGGSACKWRETFFYDIVRVILPFKDQSSAYVVKQQLRNLSAQVRTAIQPVFVSRKLNEDLKVQEAKPTIVNQQCVVYKFKVTCAMQDMWVIRVGTCTSAWMIIKESRPPFTSPTTKNTMVGYHSFFLNSFTCLRNVSVNLISSLKRCYSYASSNQDWTCKRTQFALKCLFSHPFIM